MKKHFNLIKFLVMVACLASVMLVVGCSSKADVGYDSGEYTEYESGVSDDVTDSITAVFNDNRKIHFDVTYYLESNDVSASVNRLNKIMKDNDGYIESNNYNSYDDVTTATYVIRIPSEKLDSFVAQFENGVEISSKNISSTDYTTQYVDTTAKIKALEDSRARYAAMLEDPNITFSQIQNINTQLVQIDSQLNALQIKKNQYDNLVEYSTVTVRFNQTTKEKFFDAFDGYGEYIYNICQIIVGIILYTFPVVVLAGVVLAIIFVPKAIKKKKQKNNNQ